MRFAQRAGVLVSLLLRGGFLLVSFLHSTRHRSQTLFYRGAATTTGSTAPARRSGGGGQCSERVIKNRIVLWLFGGCVSDHPSTMLGTAVKGLCMCA